MNKNNECVETCYTTLADLQKVFPNTNSEILQQIVDLINIYGKDFGIDTPQKLQHFLAQAGHESTNYAGYAFSAFEENLNYRWTRLGTEDYWQRYFNPTSNPTADPNKGDPRNFKRSSTSEFVDVEKFANWVYWDANRSSRGKLGNTQSTDGYKYRGRGIIQLTGKANYGEFNSFYQSNYNGNIDVVQNPHLVSTEMEIAVISALWFFQNKVLNKIFIDRYTTVEEVTSLINGGTKGINHRRDLTTKAKNNVFCRK